MSGVVVEPWPTVRRQLQNGQKGLGWSSFRPDGSVGWEPSGHSWLVASVCILLISAGLSLDLIVVLEMPLTFWRRERSDQSGLTEGRLPAIMPTEGSIMDHIATSLVFVSQTWTQLHSILNRHTQFRRESRVINPYLECMVCGVASPRLLWGALAWNRIADTETYRTPKLRKTIITILVVLILRSCLDFNLGCTSFQIERAVINKSLKAAIPLCQYAAIGSRCGSLQDPEISKLWNLSQKYGGGLHWNKVIKKYMMVKAYIIPRHV